MRIMISRVVCSSCCSVGRRCASTSAADPAVVRKAPVMMCGISLDSGDCPDGTATHLASNSWDVPCGTPIQPLRHDHCSVHLSDLDQSGVGCGWCQWRQGGQSFRGLDFDLSQGLGSIATCQTNTSFSFDSILTHFSNQVTARNERIRKHPRAL